MKIGLQITPARNSPDPTRPTGFRTLWIRRVEGVKLSRHCAQCLVGSYVEEFGENATAGREALMNHRIEFEPSSVGIAYLCGVHRSNRWERNLHLALSYEPGRATVVKSYDGDLFTFTSARMLDFDDIEAQRTQGHRSDSFLRCRNYQFACQIEKEIERRKQRPQFNLS